MTAQSREEAKCGRWERLDRTAVRMAEDAGGLSMHPQERQVQSLCTAKTHKTRSHTGGVTLNTYTCLGGFIAMATGDWSPEWEGRILMMVKKQWQSRIETDSVEWDNSRGTGGGSNYRAEREIKQTACRAIRIWPCLRGDTVTLQPFKPDFQMALAGDCAVDCLYCVKWWLKPTRDDCKNRARNFIHVPKHPLSLVLLRFYWSQWGVSVCSRASL